MGVREWECVRVWTRVPSLAHDPTDGRTKRLTESGHRRHIHSDFTSLDTGVVLELAKGNQEDWRSFPLWDWDMGSSPSATFPSGQARHQLPASQEHEQN